MRAKLIEEGRIFKIFSPLFYYSDYFLKRRIINNYWMRLSMIARIIKAEVCVTNRSLDNSRYHAKTESNNCFIMHIPQQMFNVLFE